jgi:hypothetical protein
MVAPLVSDLVDQRDAQRPGRGLLGRQKDECAQQE